jgi:putative FmdB family regulatory protein
VPIYEYKCEKGHVFDVMQKMSDESLSECIECGAPAQRVLTAPAIHFKGSGFHNTDYGRKSKGNGSGGSESGESKGSESNSKPAESSAKSESKASTSSTD